MKKILVPPFTLLLGAFLSCSTARKEQGTKTVTAVQPPIITYEAPIKFLIITKCGPCHLSTGEEVSYDNYTSAKENIDGIIRRIKLQPQQHGFMPQKAPRLSDSLIHVFEQWKVDGLREK